MLHRYTPAAMHCATAIRMHAMMTRSTTIDIEHLLLSLLSASGTLFGMLSEEGGQELRQALDPHAAAKGRAIVGTGDPFQQPLSDGLKRAIQQAADDAAALGHERIAPEHLLSGLVCETAAPSVRRLAEAGVTRERVWDDLRSGRLQVPTAARPTRDGLRARLLEWIDNLPDAALHQVEMLVDHRHGHAAPPAEAPSMDAGAPIWDAPPWVRPRMGAAAGGGASAARRWASRSSSWSDDGAKVFSSHRSIHGHEVVTVERFRLSDDGRMLSYAQEVRGPGRTVTHDVEFDVSGG